jgi:hypothetical protein
MHFSTEKESGKKEIQKGTDLRDRDGKKKRKGERERRIR